jgi:DNA polymerase III subunit epsilon
MRLKLTRPLLVFDLETTGTDTQRDRIVEMAAVKIWPDGRSEEKVRRFNPGIPIPKEATAIHGITDEDVRSEPSFAKVARGSKGIAAYFAGCDLAGYNIIHFDIPMLAAELERAGERFDVAGVAVIDAFRIFTRKEPRNLAGAVRFYLGREHAEAHAAMGDVRAAVAVLEAQLNRYPDLPDTPLEIDAAVRDPEEVDRRGKLRWIDGEVAVNFGRHKGRALRWLAREEPDYIRWMIENRVLEDAVHHLHDALIGHFARKEASSDEEAARENKEGTSNEI